MKETLARYLLKALRYQSIASIYPWAFDRLRDLFRGEPDRYRSLLLELAQQNDDWLEPFFAAHQLHTVWSTNPAQVRETLVNLSHHPEEMVREGAAHSWNQRLRNDFASTFQTLRNLSDSEAYEPRHTAALAPVRLLEEDPSAERKKQLKEFWESYEDDPRQGLWNLVRQQILERHGLREQT